MNRISLCILGAAGDFADEKLPYSIYGLERYRLAELEIMEDGHGW